MNVRSREQNTQQPFRISLRLLVFLGYNLPHRHQRPNRTRGLESTRGATCKLGNLGYRATGLLIAQPGQTTHHSLDKNK